MPATGYPRLRTNRTHSRDKVECRDMGRPDDREMPPIESSDGVSSEALGNRHHRSVDRPERQVAIGCYQFRDPEPVGRGNMLGHEVARSQVPEEAHFGLRSDSGSQEVGNLSYDEDRY